MSVPLTSAAHGGGSRSAEPITAQRPTPPISRAAESTAAPNGIPTAASPTPTASRACSLTCSTTSRGSTAKVVSATKAARRSLEEGTMEA